MHAFTTVFIVTSLTFSAKISEGGIVIPRNESSDPIRGSQAKNWSAFDVSTENVGQGKGFGIFSWNRVDSKLAAMISSPGKFKLYDILEQLKISIMQRIKSEAVDIVKARGDAGYGSGGGHGGGHGFGTLEIALLTLAILTFAVFLVNLIQQTIALLRMGTLTGATNLGLLGRRRRRALLDLESLQNYSTLTSLVLKAIEEPLFSKW